MEEVIAAVRAGRFGDITSVVVSRGRRVVCEEYADGQPELLRNTRSCTKTVASLLVGLAIERTVPSTASKHASTTCSDASIAIRGVPRSPFVTC